MPYKASRACLYLNCDQLVPGGGYCPDHQRTAASNRPGSTARGYNYKWQKARAHWLKRNPLCVACQEKGITRLATDVDHIQPHRGNKQLFWDKTNWQALCHSCHSSKTAREQGGGDHIPTG